jgi:signal transduction histidine kinase
MDERSPGADAPPRSAARLEAEIKRLRTRVAELERQKAKVEAEHAEVEAFAAVAAHELLSGVVMIDALRRSATRTRLLVQTLLHHGRSDGRPLRRRPIDLNRMLRESLTLLAPEIKARDAEVHGAELPHIRGERTLIGVLFTNLLINALKYGPRERGAIVVGASREEAA